MEELVQATIVNNQSISQEDEAVETNNTVDLTEKDNIVVDETAQDLSGGAKLYIQADVNNMQNNTAGIETADIEVSGNDDKQNDVALIAKNDIAQAEDKQALELELKEDEIATYIDENKEIEVSKLQESKDEQSES